MRVHLIVWAALILGAAVCGCAQSLPKVEMQAQADEQRRVEPGDTVFVTYTCYTPDGKLAATTDPATAAFDHDKAHIFAPPYEPGPVLVTAGDEDIQRIHTRIGPEDFDRAVSAYLARAVVGQPYSRSVRVEIDAEIQKSITDSERYLKLNRHQQVKKENLIPVSTLEEMMGHSPEIGDVQPVVELPGVSVRVVELEEDRALIRTEFPEGTRADDDFGKKRFVDLDDTYFKTVIETEVGFRVRSGDIVGRVAAIDDQFLTMDYGDPFGGVRLTCDVTAVPVKQ